MDDTVFETVMSFAKEAYPNEAILLFRGRRDAEKVVLSEVVIPPLATHGDGFSSFNMHMLPADPSLMGVAHSHPSGVLRPSIQDLNMFYGRVMVIVAYPYLSVNNMAAFDNAGKRVKIEITRL